MLELIVRMPKLFAALLIVRFQRNYFNKIFILLSLFFCNFKHCLNPVYESACNKVIVTYYFIFLYYIIIFIFYTITLLHLHLQIRFKQKI